MSVANDLLNDTLRLVNSLIYSSGYFCGRRSYVQVKTVAESFFVPCKISSIDSAVDHHITSKLRIDNKDIFINAVQKYQFFLLDES